MMKNEYQEALDRLKLMEHYQNGDEYDILQELVCKETPMKPEMFVPSIFGLQIPVAHCPKCKRLGRKYRCECGQKIDWSKENEK